MRKVSVVVPVYNEEFLLPIFLDRVVPIVDEVVIVDGGLHGKSGDGTADIISKYDVKKVKHLIPSKPFVLEGGKWDRASQVNTGIEKATGDVIIHTSVDVMFDSLGQLVRHISEREEQVYHIPSVQFWLDTNHVRLDDGKAHSVDLFAVAKDCVPTYGSDGFVATAAVSDIIWSVGTTRYHLGWVRPFTRQIAKHMRNIKSGAWGEIGEKVAELGESAIEAWAIHHILRYGNIDHRPILPLADTIPDQVRTMTCTDGLDEYIIGYKERIGKDFYLGIMSAIPPELIVG